MEGQIARADCRPGMFPLFSERLSQMLGSSVDHIRLVANPGALVTKPRSLTILSIRSKSPRASGKTFVCFKTIYHWLYAGRLVAGEVKVLRHKGKRRKPLETRGRFLVGKTIGERPKAVKKRETFGHWELDTVVSSRGKSRACAATFIERSTCLYLAIKMPDRTALSMEIAFGVAAGQFPQGTFQTATVDRGKEFACHVALEICHGLSVYFADPYSSWQRGSNENGNGLLREFFPKGKDFAEVTDEELAHALNLINPNPYQYGHN